MHILCLQKFNQLHGSMMFDNDVIEPDRHINYSIHLFIVFFSPPRKSNTVLTVITKDTSSDGTTTNINQNYFLKKRSTTVFYAFIMVVT